MRLPTERIRELGTRLAGVPAWLVQLVRGGTLPKWVIPTVGTLSLLAVLVPGFARHEPGDENADTGAASQRLEDSARTDSHAAPLEYAALDSDSDRYAGGLEEPWAEGAPDAVGEESTPTLACIIEPNQVVEIGSPITGLIEAIPVERAEVVEEGQVLVMLESHVEKAAVELARKRAGMDEGVKAGKARHQLGKTKSSRVNRLFEQDAMSKELKDEAETEAELARLELVRARKEKQLAALELEKALAVLERRTIHSPISGVVVERKMSPGERVDQETILKVAQIDPLRVEVILPSSMFGAIQEGARATVVPEFPGDTVHVANVTIVDRVIDAASGTFGVRMELPNPEHAIPGGVHCQVRFLEE
jgi:RND family efflux transporter MFP subunit